MVSEEDFFKNLVEIKSKYGISYTKLANKIGVAEKTISNWVKGKCCPRSDWDRKLIIEKIVRSFSLDLKV